MLARGGEAAPGIISCVIAEHPVVAAPPDRPDPASEGPTRRRFTAAEYHAMGEAGILAEDERVELIGGEIVRMTPIGSRHAGCVKSLIRLMGRALGDRGIVSAQDPIVLDGTTEPQPDFAILRFREDTYRSAHPQPADVLLVIEVADSSLEYDRRVKIPLYARAGIPETWLVRLEDGCIEVHRDPAATGYREMRTFRPGDAVAPLAFPDLEVAVAAVLG